MSLCNCKLNHEYYESDVAGLEVISRLSAFPVQNNVKYVCAVTKYYDQLCEKYIYSFKISDKFLEMKVDNKEDNNFILLRCLKLANDCPIEEEIYNKRYNHEIKFLVRDKKIQSITYTKYWSYYLMQKTKSEIIVDSDKDYPILKKIQGWSDWLKKLK